MVSRFAAFALGLMLALGISRAADAPPVAADLFVSPAGNDGWSGRFAEANADRSDGPLATVDAARLKVRALLHGKEPPPKRSVRVALRGGTYFLAKPIVFTAEDSAAADATTYEAYGDEHPVLSGGVPITGWKVHPDGRWVTTLDDVKAGAWDFSQLFVNGERRMRPRLPKKGYYHIAARAMVDNIAAAPKSRHPGDDRFRYAEREISSDWINRSDIEVVTFHPWFTSMLRIADVDAPDKIVSFTGSTRSTDGWAQLGGGMRYVVENVAEALSEPGEWYLDRPTGVLTYIPMPGESPEKAQVIAPRLAEVVVIGALGTGPDVSGLQFRGLTFAHTNWTTPKEGSSIPQAAVSVGGAVIANGATDLAFDGCTFTKLGTYGLELSKSRNVQVTGCTFSDLGGGGVKVGTPTLPAAADTHGISIVDNTMAHLGRIHPAAVGVWIGHAADVTVEHNDIYDLYYTCISSGWTWGYSRTVNKNIRIAYNDLHDYGQSVLSDMGAVYTLGASPNSVVEFNRIHDCNRDQYGGWGIYYDEGSSGWVGRNNLLYRLHDGGFHQHYGADNVYENNVLIDSREVQWGPTRIDSPATPGRVIDRTAITFDRNIIQGWAAASVVRQEAMGDLIQKHTDKLKVDHNVYWNYGKEVKFGGIDFAAWQKRGLDVDSIIADPKLPRDFDRQDFRVPDDSPAVKLGFKPFDIRKAGRLKHAPADLDFKRWPRWFPRVAEMTKFSDDFEGTPAGQLAAQSTSHEEAPAATVRVSSEAAFEGTQSLKFTDAPNLRASYDPHIFWSFAFGKGTVTSHFALRTDGAAILHEWRTRGNPYETGPAIMLESDGTLRAGKKELCQLKPGQWVAIDLRCPIGEKADGTFSATVTPQGGEAMHFEALPCSPAFRELSWFGFSAVGDKGVAYLDDVRVEEILQ